MLIWSAQITSKPDPPSLRNVCQYNLLSYINLRINHQPWTINHSSLTGRRYQHRTEIHQQQLQTIPHQYFTHQRGSPGCIHNKSRDYYSTKYPSIRTLKKTTRNMNWWDTQQYLTHKYSTFEKQYTPPMRPLRNYLSNKILPPLTSK